MMPKTYLLVQLPPEAFYKELALPAVCLAVEAQKLHFRFTSPCLNQYVIILLRRQIHTIICQGRHSNQKGF